MDLGLLQEGVSEPAAGGLLFIPGEKGSATAQKAAQTVYEVPS